MDPLTRIEQEAELRRLTRAKLIHRHSAPSISLDIVNVYRQSVKRTKKLGGIGHLYQLNQLLLAGLRNQLITACRGCGLKKITLKAGSGDSRESRADRRMDFD